LEEYLGTFIRGEARNVRLTNNVIDGILVPDFDSEQPRGRRLHCIPCDVYGDGRDFAIRHSSGDHEDPPAALAPSGRRADRRPRSPWLTLWVFGRRVASWIDALFASVWRGPAFLAVLLVLAVLIRAAL
jgi:hypothetical protein